jgi:mannose-1-phosphate guanylyltransferase
MKALILAGGFGTRLRPLTKVIPKPLLPVNNVPLLAHQLDILGDCEGVVLATHYMTDLIVEYITKEGLDNVIVNPEPTPMGTGGAIRNARYLLGDEFFVLNGDIICDADLKELREVGRRNDGFAMLTRKVSDASRYGSVDTNDDMITSFDEKASSGTGLINAGIYYLTSDVFSYFPKESFVSIEHDVFPRLVRDEKLFSSTYGGPWHDIGTREDYINANLSLSGSDNIIGSGCNIVDSTIHRSVILDGCHIQDCTIKDSVIGPHVILREREIDKEIVI